MSQQSCDMSEHTGTRPGLRNSFTPYDAAVNNVAITGEFLNASRDENAPRLNQDPSDSEFHSKPCA